MDLILTENIDLVNLIDAHENSVLIEFILFGKARVFKAVG